MSIAKELFEDTKNAVLELLKPYDVIRIDTDEKLEPSQLYLADKKLNDELTYHQLNLERGLEEKDYKKYGFVKIVKFLNPGNPARHYNLYVEKKWKQINNPETVLKKIDAEFNIWKNTYTKHAFEELLEVEDTTQEFIDKQKEDIERKIEFAKKEKDYLVDNFDDFTDIRICSRTRANDYGTINYVCDDKKRKAHMSAVVPTVLYYEKPMWRKNNKLSGFLQVAVNMFGDVYYIK